MLFGGELYKNCPIRARNHTSSHAKRKSCRNDSKCVGANTEKGRRERNLFSSRIARENHLRT